MDQGGQLQGIVDLPGFFHCERANCDLKISACIGRQEANAQRHPFEPIPYAICQDCQKGKGYLVQAEPFPEGTKPKRGKGQRKSDCDLYGKCLDFAAKRDWKSWNCYGCPVIEGVKAMPTEDGIAKVVNTRICEDCKSKPTIHSNHPLCASCMAKRSNSSPNRTQKAQERRKRKHATEDKRKVEISRPRPDLKVLISFSQHPEILDALKAAAEREIRPLDLQVIYLLKKGLEEVQG